MIVSWNWLKEYVAIDVDREELELRLAMSGLNHEDTFAAGDDFAIDLEVTSNRPDCLGHIGVAREISILTDVPLKLPSPAPAEGKTSVSDLTKVRIETESCTRYTARVIRGVKIGPSPDWLAKRLRTLAEPKLKTDKERAAWNPINNVVDITNYVLMECGQPLHAFDFAKLAGPEIIVRNARKGEKIEAIDHETYELSETDCVIADAERPVAIGGVMGGAATEVTDATTDLLIEVADFAPLAIRTTSRALKLPSDSSYRFERGVDPEGLIWASNRCCELILDIAGGELASGIIDVGAQPVERKPLVLRLSHLERILGIKIPSEDVRRILKALGNEETKSTDSQIEVVPPSWRRDITREVDLFEEVGRLHGYDKIPEDVAVPMAASYKTPHDRVMNMVRGVLAASGFDEVLTRSVVSEDWVNAFNGWSSAEPLRTITPMVSGENCLRQSTLPSLLNVRRENQAQGNARVEIFETAKVYLPSGEALPREPWVLGIVSGADFFTLKGVVESIVEAVNPDANLSVAATDDSFFDSQKACSLQLDGKPLGFLGEVSEKQLSTWKHRSAAFAAELDLGVLIAAARITPQFQGINRLPGITQELNFIVEEPLAWSQLAATVTEAAGADVESVEYRETYRNKKADGEGKKRVLLAFTLRSRDATLTREDAETVREQIVSACAKQHSAVLVG